MIFIDDEVGFVTKEDLKKGIEYYKSCGNLSREEEKYLKLLLKIEEENNE